MMTRLKLKFSSGRSFSCGLFLTAWSLLLGGCSNEDGIGSDGNRAAVRFHAGISVATRTTNGGDAWSADDAVGIFMLKQGGMLSNTPDIYAENERYKVNASNGELTGNAIYYPAGDEKVDFIAYYLYDGNITGSDYNYAVSVADQSDPASIDVLYARVENASNNTEVVSLVFDHVLSKVTFNVKLGTGFDASAIAELTGATIEGMPASASMTLQDGTITAGENGNIIMLKATEATIGYGATFSAIIVPQEAGSGRKVVFTIGGGNYECTLPDNDVFAKGKHYTYPVTVNETGIVLGTPSIDKWMTNRNEGQGTLTEIAPNIEKVFIKAGTFMMGSPETEPGRGDETLHQVTLTQNFYMSKYEITNAQYAEFLNDAGIGSSGQTWTSGGTQTLIKEHERGVKYEDGAWKPQNGYENYPVVNVSWYGADEFARWIGGSLPTEAQWEYACRAGTETIWSFGDDEGELGDYTWFGGESGNSEGVSHEVGTKKPNRWGLYDMHGNVAELCSDTGNGGDYPNGDAAVVDPGRPKDNYYSYAHLRGGHFFSHVKGTRSASRGIQPFNQPLAWVGFRVIFVL